MTVSFLLAVASVIGLVVFLAHLARQIRVETMLRDVHRDATATIDAVLTPRAEPGATEPVPPLHASIAFAPSSGFLVRVDTDDLLECARVHDVHFVLDAHPGDSLVAGTPIGSVWSPAGPLRPQDVERIQSGLARAMHVGFERTAAQDVGYGLRQLTDVANKALSPGINDPTTAIHALGHIAAVLCELAGRDLGPVLLTDDDGEVRVVLRRPGLAELVDVAISQPRRYGSSDPQVMARLFRLLEELAWHITTPAQRRIVEQHLGRVQATVRTADFDHVEIEQLHQAHARVGTVLDRAHDRAAP